MDIGVRLRRKDQKLMSARTPRRSRASGEVRIEDVARLAEVSAQTVSRFFRDPSVVSADTSERIRRAAEAVGYVPNLIAGSLASNRSRIVAIVVPTIANPAHSVWVQGLTDALSAEGYQVLLGATNYDPVREHDLVRTFLGRRVDGVAITGASLEPHAEALLRRSRTATIQIFELPERPIDMAIGVDNDACGVAIANHLADRGYRRLAVVGSRAATDTRAAARTTGFLRQAVMRGLQRPTELGVTRPADVGVGPELLQDILAINPPIEAVFCVGTQISIGLMLACPPAGVNVPKRLAVAGFSDGDLAAMLTPSLTTIRVPTAEMGRKAGRMLLARLAGAVVDSPTIDVGFELSVGAST
jgi:LacI family gluconate utilization system Gnt-I transcriptional repressor